MTTGECDAWDTGTPGSDSYVRSGFISQIDAAGEKNREMQGFKKRCGSVFFETRSSDLTKPPTLR